MTSEQSNGLSEVDPKELAIAQGEVIEDESLSDEAADSGESGSDELTATEAAAEQPAKVSWSVILPAIIISLALVAPAAIWPNRMSQIVQSISGGVVNDLGWYYTLIVVIFVFYCAFLAVSRFGDVKLGPDDAEPEYSRMSWFAMLFAAGMGIGLVFWGVAEPLSHYTSPPPGANASSPAAAAQEAMNTTFLHWGLSAWAVYVIVGIGIAYMSHRRGRPVSIRWMLEPLLGDRVKGWVGDLIDVTALVGTLFGVATSLGFGATQFSAGLEYVGLIQQSPTLLLIIVIGISALAGLSVASGLDVGIKWLSNGNLVLAAVLLVTILFLGQPLFVMREFVESIGHYIQNFIPLSFRTMPFQGAAGEEWLSSWTTYYWGWWMSWSPFVGIFIARISRGRTIREFVMGVLAVPTLVTFLWFAGMGGTALWYQMNTGVDLTAAADWTTTALFTLAHELPGGPVLTGLFMALLVIFFVTSSDSASFVLGILSANGVQTPPLFIRLFWATVQGAIAALLLWLGAVGGSTTEGLKALQVLSILTALPFSVVMLLTCVSMYRALRWEDNLRLRAERELLRDRITAIVERTVDRSGPPRKTRVPSWPMPKLLRRRSKARGE